jgi:hypothetical protein
MPPRTDDGRVMAIAQLITDNMIFGIKYWDIVEKTIKYIFLGTQRQNSANSSAKNTLNAQISSTQFVCPSPKV